MHNAKTKPEKNNGMSSARSVKTIRNGLTQPYFAYPQQELAMKYGSCNFTHINVTGM
jgi:hypothetical protein